MIVSVTELMTYNRCPRKWWLSSLNRQRFTAIQPAEALEEGKLIHVAGERWIRHYTDDPAYPFEQHLLDAATEELERLTEVYETLTKRPPPTSLLDDYWKWITLCRAMCRNYQAYYKTPLPKEYTLVQPEQQVVVAIPNTEHYLEGTLDAIIADDQGRHFVYERKTYGQRPNVRHLQRDFQFLCYDWILHQSTDLAYGICYDGLWKRPSPPAGKTTADLFFRYFMSRNDDERDELELLLAMKSQEMAARPTDQCPIDKVVPGTRGCLDCLDLLDLCDAISNGDSQPLHLYTQRDLTPAFQAFYRGRD